MAERSYGSNKLAALLAVNCYILVLLSSYSIRAAAAETCPNGQRRLSNGRCFGIGEGTKEWPNARRVCQNNGGDLGIFKTVELYVEMLEWMKELELTAPVYIGLRDPDAGKYAPLY